MTTEIITPKRLQTPIRKVFLALRTDFFGDLVEDEHITLRYFDSVLLSDLVRHAEWLDKTVPSTIKLNGFANWQASGMFYEVALVDWWENPALYAGVRTPHITIRKSNKPLSNATFVPDFYGQKIQLIDRLWVGKKIKGKIQWVPVKADTVANDFKFGAF